MKQFGMQLPAGPSQPLATQISFAAHPPASTVHGTQ
jgi:hypothetical protein